MASLELLLLTLPLLLLAALLYGRRLLCWLVGHEVGPARTEPVPAGLGRREHVRVSRCVRCRHPFLD